MGKGKGRSKGKNGTPQRSVVRTRESHNVSNSSHEQSILTTSDSKVVQKFVSQSSTRTTCETSEEHTHNGFSTGAFGGNAGSEFDISLNNNKKAAATTGHSLIPELDPRFKVTKEHREYYNTGPQEYYDGNTHIKYHESGNNFYREAHYDSRDNQNQPTDQDIHVEERRSSNKSNDLREVFDQRGQNHEGASKRRSGVYEVPIERKNVGSHLSLNIPYQPDNEINIPLNNKKFSSHRDIPILFEERRHSDEQASNAHEERKLSRHPSNGSSIHMTQAVPDAYKTVYVSSSNIHNDRSRAQSQNRLQAGDDNHQHHRSRSVSVPRNRLDGGAYDVSNRDEIVHSNSHNYEKSTIEQSRNERILSGAPSIKNQQEQDPRSRTNSVRSHISEKEFGFGDVIDEPLSRQASRRSNRRYDAKDQISQDEFLLIGGCPPSSNTIHSRISYTEPSDGNIRSNQDEWRASQTSLHGHGDGGRSSEYYQQPSLTTRTLSAQSLHDGERVLSGLLGADGDYTKTLGSQSNLLDRHGEPQTPSGTDVRQRSRSLNRYGETVEIPFNNLAHGPHSRATSKCSVTTMNTDDRLLLASQHRSRLEDDIGPVPKRRSRSTMNLGSDQITENTIRSHHSHSAHSKTDNEDRVIFSDIPTLHGHPDDVFGDDDEPGVPFRPTKEHAFTPNNRPSTKPPVRPHSDTVNTYGADVEIPLNQVRRTVSNQSLDAPPAPLAYSSVLTPVGKHFSDYDVSVQDTPNTVINEPRCVKTIFQPLTTEIAIQTGDTIRVRNENGSAQPTVVKNTINANKPKMNSSFERNGHPAANVLTNMLQTRRKDEVTETTHHEHRHRVSKRYSENDHHTHVDENFNIKPKGVPSNAPRVIPPQSSFKPAATSSPTRLSDQGPTPSRLQPRPDRRQRSPASSIGSRNEVFFSKLNSPTKSEYDDDEELIRKIADAKWTGNKNSGDTLRLHVKPGKIKDLASAFDNLQTESKKQEHVLDQKTRSKSANRWIQPSEQPKRGSQGSEPVRRNDVDERISNQKRVEKSRRSEEIRREIEEQRILEERNALTRQREEEERIWRLNEQRRQEAEDREAKAREEEERIWRLNEQRRQEAEDREAKTREEEERIWRLDEQRRQEAEDREAKTREELSNIEKIRREIEAQREIDERNRILRQREVDVNAWTTREHRVNERNSHYQKTEESSNVDKIRREIDEQRAIDERERIQRQRDDEERAWRLQEQKRQFDERNTIFQKSEETSNVQKIKKEIEKQRVVDEQNTRYRQDRGSDNRDEYRQHRPQQKKYGQNFPHETVQRRVEETRRNEEIRNERVERRQIPDQNHARGDHYDNSGHLSQNSSTTSSRGALDAVPNSRESLYQPKTPTTPQLKDFTNFDDFAARPCSKPYAERPEEPLGGGDKYGSLTKIQHGAVRSLRDNFETKTSSHTKQRESVRRTRSEVPTDQRLLYSVPKPYTRPDGSISNASQASSTYKHVTPARSYSLRRDPITVPINRKAPFGTESNQPVVRNVQDVRTTSNNNYENISNYTTHHNQTTNKHSRYETPVYANQEAFKSVPREVPVDARFPEPAWNGQNTVPVDNVHQSSTHKIHNTVHRENVDHHTHHHHQSTRPSHVNPNSYVHVDTKTPITKQPRANIPPAEQVSRSNKDRLWEEKVRRREEEERMEEERRKTERQYAFENVQQIDDFHPTGKRPNMPVGTGYTTDDACSRITHPSFAGHKTDEESSIRGKIDKMFAFVEHDESRKSTIEVPVDVHFGKPQHPEFKTFEVPIDRTPRKEATEWKTQPGSGWKTNEMCRNSVPGANEHYEHVEHRYLTRTVHETENVAYSLKDYRDIQRAVGRHDQHLLQEEPQFYRSPAAASHAGQSLHTYHAKDIVGTPAIGEKLLTNVREVPIALATSTPNESPQSHRGAVGCTFNCSDTFVSSISGLSMVEVQADYRKKIHKLQYMIETSTKQMTLNELALVDAQKNNKIHHEISAHRALLISRETVRLQRDELRRLHALSAVRRPPPPVSRELKSTATFSNITLHLNKNFCQRHNDNGSYAFMVLLKSGHRVEATEFVPLFNDSNSEYQTMVHFGQTIRFADLPVDFAVHLEAFAMRIPNPRHVEPAPSSLKEKCKSLMGPPQKKVAPQPVEHLFRMRGRITLDRDAVGHRRFYLDEISYPLEGTIDINTECSQLPEAIDMDYRGFMAIYQTVGNVASWERYWAVLRRGVVFFWKYPDDENTQKCPLMQMDLTKCTNQSIEQCPPEICPRPYSFYIEMLVNAQSTVIEKKRVLLSSDTPEMLNSWLLALNETLSVIRGPSMMQRELEVY